ncbi:GNAT family N-acetyltransferase [Daejeonia sp. YH14]|uniref:GNAT family N-acetyltransferase n=1 Tax=Daejeonia sp. YH14 TaxID=3439042 RepID=UPI003F499657
MISVRLYESKDFEIWNDFVAKAKNSTFLFHRNFIEYHHNRFQDFSLMVFENENLIALLPANRVGKDVFSHQGLTYGGIVIKQKLRMTAFFDVFSEILKFLNDKRIAFLHWKEVPFFYDDFPNDEWKYLTFVTEAELYRRDLCSVIDLRKDYYISKSVERYVKSSEKTGIYYRKCNYWKEFWNEILEPELLRNHNVSPVHSLEEILNLKCNFEDNIHLYGVFSNEELLGGTVVFTGNHWAHAQYICVKSEHRDKKALNLLFYKLINEEFRNYDFFDFGISNENNGKKLNRGLLYWKEGFGARGVSQDFYKISTQNYNLIEKMYL